MVKLFKRPLGISIGVAIIFIVPAILYFSGTQNSVSLEDSRKLVIYSYSSMTASWGAGPHLKELFEKKCKCVVEFVDVGEAGLLVQRLKLEGAGTRADVVMGIDQLSVREADQENLWLEIPKKDVSWHADLKQDETIQKHFIPYDWAPLTFIYREGEVVPPKKKEDLLSARFQNKISLMDPRTSSPGFVFLAWMMSKGTEGQTFLTRLLQTMKPLISPSWSTAYGLFKKKSAQLVFSYATSAVYHWIEDKDESYQPAVLDEPVPVQIEYSAIPKSCARCELAEEFIDFLLTPEAQEIVMTKNWMLPVVQGVQEDTRFNELPRFKLDFLMATTQNREEWLKAWKSME